MKTALVLLLASVAWGDSGQPNVTNARFETRAFTGTTSNDLAGELRTPRATWFGYAVKTTPGDHHSCCYMNGMENGCRLEGGTTNTVKGGSTSGPVALEGPASVAILFRVENNVLQKLRVYSLECPLDAGGLVFVWLTGVTAKASLGYLEQTVKTNDSDAKLDSAIMAISQHEDSGADDILANLTKSSEPEKVREKALFWLGASRGAKGVPIIRQALLNDPSEQVRDKAVFALSISKQPEAMNDLIEAARRDSSAHVRGQAIFWLSQKAGERAVSAITNAIQNDPDTEVKKHAVFALSQLPKDEGVPKLIEVARNQKNAEVRKQAFFWLGQSHDPRALAYITTILTN